MQLQQHHPSELPTHPGISVQISAHLGRVMLDTYLLLGSAQTLPLISSEFDGVRRRDVLVVSTGMPGSHKGGERKHLLGLAVVHKFLSIWRGMLTLVRKQLP